MCLGGVLDVQSRLSLRVCLDWDINYGGWLVSIDAVLQF